MGTGLEGCGGGEGVRCGLPGKRGRLRPALRLPTADSLCDLKVARASRISGRKFSAAARRKPTGLTSAEMAAPICIAAARTGFLLAALHSVAKRVRHGQAHHLSWSVPVCPEDRTAPRLRRHDPQLRSQFRAIAVGPRAWKQIARLGVLVLAEAWSRALLSQQPQMGTSRAH